MDGMFEKATKIKLRFPCNKGLITVEDLWSLPLESRDGVNLDEIARTINKRIKENAEESFVKKKSNTNIMAELALNIVKRVIQVRQDEAEARKKAADTKEKKQQILRLINDKENTALAEKPIEDLKKMLEDL